MIRVATIACFTLTLFCPVVCLAGRDDSECSASTNANSENCEAVAIGAVIEKSDHAFPSSLDQWLPSIDRVPRVDIAASGCRVYVTGWHHEWPKPPPADRRQAILQIFLF